MNLAISCLLAAGLVAAPFVLGADAPEPVIPQVLVFSKTLGFRHGSIANGIEAIRDLGAKNGFGVETNEDSSAFTTENLARFQAVVFLSVTGDVLNPDQERAFQEYIENGGGFAGIHGAIFGPRACEETWAWYGGVFCCTFTNHSKVLPGTVTIENAGHPANEGLPQRWERADEWYNFSGSPRGAAHILASVDEATYQGGTVGTDHPIAWCRKVGNGRMWYTAMGHTPQSFSEPFFRQHLLNGIRLAAGLTQGDLAPNPCMPSREALGSADVKNISVKDVARRSAPDLLVFYNADKACR